MNFYKIISTDIEAKFMAKTGKGKKIVSVDPYKRAKPGQKKKTIPVKRHRRSTPE